MVTFNLFGTSLQLSEGANPIGQLGGMPVQGTVTLSSAQLRMTIRLQGAVCGVQLDLSWRGSIQISGGVATLAATPRPTTSLTASLLLPGPTSVLLTSPVLQVATDAALGLQLLDQNGAAFVWSQQHLPPDVNVDLTSRTTTIELDVRRSRARHRPGAAGGPKLTWVDRFLFRSNPPTAFGPSQSLMVESLDTDATGFEALSRPQAGALFLHADVLDTSSRDDTSNPLLFQYAVVNGRLRVAAPGGGPPTMLWESAPGVAEPMAIILLRQQDEHGYPLAIVPDAAVPLGTRVGVSGTVYARPDTASWSQTNRARVIAPIAVGHAVPQVLGQLRSLSVRKLYSAFSDDGAPKNSMTAPWFVHNGVVPLDSTFPREVHGLSRGARLQSKHAAPLPGQERVSLVVEPLLDGADTIFHHTQLEFAEAGHWDVLVLREERDVKPGETPPPIPAPQTVGVHRLAGVVGKGAFRLPAVDLTYAAANLTGVDRVNRDGARLGSGALPSAVKAMLVQHEDQFLDQFAPPAIPAQRHVDGARILPPADQAFARLLDRLPTAATVDTTGRLGPDLRGAQGATLQLLSSLAAPPTDAAAARLVFGGDDGPVTAVADQLRDHANDAQGAWGAAFRTFESSWRASAADPDVLALRDTMGILARPAALDPAVATELLDAAIKYLRASDNVGDIAADTEDADALADYFAALPPEEFVGDWANPSPGTALLFEHVWSPANYDLMRRIVRMIGPGALCTKLFGIADISGLVRFLDVPSAGLLQGVAQGVDGLWDTVVSIYETGLEPGLIALRDKYGARLTHDVYARLLEIGAQADADHLLDLINLYLASPLRRLGDVSADPPEYLVRTKRFAVAKAGKEPLVDALWQQCFDLCAFATDKAWTFFFDDDTSVLIKLSRKRSLPDMLREVVQTYGGADRPDPLGLRPYSPPGATPLAGDEIINRFIDDLDPDLKDPSWVGVVLLRPVADIHQDVVLRDLAGFDHITASYIAIGGRRPTVDSPKPPAIDVWAHIFRENPNGGDLPKDPGTIGDVKLALTKFDVRLRQTQLSAADIEVEIYPQDVWGSKKSYPTVTLHGTLQAPAGNPDGPKDLTFSAFFPTPFTLDIDVAFVKELELSRLRVARRNGSTSIDIDGELRLQKPRGLDLAIDLAEKDLRLSLQDFRIQVPTLSGYKVEVGARRRLAFDLPALSFALPKPRAFNLFGVEIVPTGLGYIRGNEPEAFGRFVNDYVWLKRLDITGAPANVFVSYMTFAVDFGKSPSFGLVDARGLRFDLALALKVENNSANAAYLGISGLDAKDLKLSIFGFLTLEIQELRISPAQLLTGAEAPAPGKVNAGAILAEDLRLKIFNWSPTPAGSKLDLLMLHPSRDPTGTAEDNRRKGLLAYYDRGAKPPTGSFFELYWMVLAHNMELPAKALNHLLEQNPGESDPAGLLGQLLDKPDESPPKPRASLVLRDVRLLDRESWLFGLSFKLGMLFERCSFVLHDQHYYGIRLWSKWVKTIFKQDSLELAYIPGPTRAEDRFRTNLRIPLFDMLGTLKAGEFALEWGVTWDFLIDVGFPWRTSIGYDWFRAFSMPVGCYEAKIGFYIEKKTLVVQDNRRLTLTIGMGLYIGYYFGAGNSVAWVRAGIGVFAILEGRITLQSPASGGDLGLLKSSIYSIEIVGVIGVLAYGEGGVDVWILSASFRVSAQVAVSCTISYVAGGPCSLGYSAVMAAGYSASVQVGCGFCSWTFSVHGEVSMGVSGQLLLS